MEFIYLLFTSGQPQGLPLDAPPCVSTMSSETHRRASLQSPNTLQYLYSHPYVFGKSCVLFVINNVFGDQLRSHANTSDSGIEPCFKTFGTWIDAPGWHDAAPWHGSFNGFHKSGATHLRTRENLHNFGAKFFSPRNFCQRPTTGCP